MDFPAPVANQIQPPNQQQSLNAYSGMLGIQQQKQQLQTGQYLQQTAQAEAQQNQQKNAELQRAQQVMARAAQGGYSAPDGSLDRVKMSQDLAAIGPYAAQVSGQMVSQANEMTQNKTAIQNLTVARKKEIGATIQSLVQDPNLDQSKFIDEIERLRSQHPNDPEFSRLLTSTTTNALRGDESGPQLKAKLGQMWSALSGEQQASPGTLDVGGQIYPGAVNKQTGAFTPAQPGVQKTLAPTDMPGYKAQVATATGAATGQVGTDSQVFQRVISAGADSARGVELAQKVEQEAGMVRTGKYSKEFADRLTLLQQHDPSVTARQLLQKDAENLKTLAEGTATTDSERQQIGAGFPSPETMDPDAVQKASRYWQGSFKLAGARRDNAISHVGQNGSVAGLALKDADFMKNSTPGKYAPPEPKKQMPTGARLKAYADKYTGGDVNKAQAALGAHGYE